MSSAFIKEQDGQWLGDIAPTMNALINYLTKDNNGIKAYEQRSYTHENGKMIHVMNNGLSYMVDDEGKWKIVD